MLSGVPPIEVAVPPPIAALADGEPVRPVWINELDGVTFALGERRFAKWAPAGSGLPLGDEAARLRWAAPYTSVPRVLDHGRDADGEWLVTSALPGENAVSARWKASPRTAAAGIGTGLRRLHDALPVGQCPFSWGAEDRLSVVRELVAAGHQVPSRWEQEHAHLSAHEALAMLADVPPVDRLVVCHGDTCPPNTLLSSTGTCTGHVDLGSLGVADRWADLAVATWSLDWNYGPGWEPVLLAAYGVDPDPVRTAYYRLLWDLGP
jgi:kanamycin kinase